MDRMDRIRRGRESELGKGMRGCFRQHFVPLLCRHFILPVMPCHFEFLARSGNGGRNMDGQHKEAEGGMFGYKE
jgi:hypothetical protein